MKAGDIFTNTQGSIAKVIEYRKSTEVLVEFQDTWQHMTTFHAHALRNGNFKNPYHPTVAGIGFLGIGKYTRKEYPISSAAWAALLYRMSVCVEWHHYQEFAEWHESLYYPDSSVLTVGKVASPDNTTLIPLTIKCLLSTKRKSGLPIGVKKSGSKYYAQLYNDTVHESSCAFDSVEEASNWYLRKKTDQIMNLESKFDLPEWIVAYALDYIILNS